MKKLLLVFVSILTLISILLVPIACKEAVEVNTIPENPGGADLADLGMIAFISSRWGNQKDIYLMNSDGTAVYNYSYSPMIDEDEVELDVSGYWMVWTAPIPQAKGTTYLADADIFMGDINWYSIRNISNVYGPERSPSIMPYTSTVYCSSYISYTSSGKAVTSTSDLGIFTLTGLYGSTSGTVTGTAGTTATGTPPTYPVTGTETGTVGVPKKTQVDYTYTKTPGFNNTGIQISQNQIWALVVSTRPQDWKAHDPYAVSTDTSLDSDIWVTRVADLKTTVPTAAGTYIYVNLTPGNDTIDTGAQWAPLSTWTTVAGTPTEKWYKSLTSFTTADEVASTDAAAVAKITTTPSTTTAKIVYVSTQTGAFQIYLMTVEMKTTVKAAVNLATGAAITSSSGTTYDSIARVGTPVALTSGNSSNSQPCWSPNGQWIAFASTRDGNSEIYAMKADGSKQTRLTYNDSGDYGPSWSIGKVNSPE